MASILAKELAQDLGIWTASRQIKSLCARASGDAQDLGSILVIAAGSGLGAGLIELAKDAGKGDRERRRSIALARRFLTRFGPSYANGARGRRLKLRPAMRSSLARNPAALPHRAPRLTPRRLRTSRPWAWSSSGPARFLIIRAASSTTRFQALGGACEKGVVARSYGFQRSEGAGLFRQGSRLDDIVDRIEAHVEAHPRYARRGALLLRARRPSAGSRAHLLLVLKGTKPGREVSDGFSHQAVPSP